MNVWIYVWMRIWITRACVRACVHARERETTYRRAMSLREDMEASRTMADSSAREETRNRTASAIEMEGETKNQRKRNICVCMLWNWGYLGQVWHTQSLKKPWRTGDRGIESEARERERERKGRPRCEDFDLILNIFKEWKYKKREDPEFLVIPTEVYTNLGIGENKILVLVSL